MMPGTRLMQFARRWFSPSTVSSVFEPLVADWQRQWNDATPAQRRWINARGFAAFATTTAMMAPRLVLASGTLRVRPLVLAACFWFATSILLALPFREPLNLLWLVLPSTLTLMLPFAILPALDAMRRDGEEPTTADRRGALMLVIVAACGVAIGQGWVTPVANQYYRNETTSRMNGRPSVAWKGVRERTTLDLIAGEGSTIPAPARTRELTNRATLALLPAVLVWLRWRSLGRARHRSWPVVKSCLLAFGIFAAFVMVMAAGPPLERMFVAPGFGPLLALGLFALTARTGIWWRQRAV
jgi:hypothetical protein